MKKQIITLLFTCIGSIALHAQTVNITNCYIRYQYDQAGNRVNRDFYCYYDPTYAKIMPRDSLQTIEDGLFVYPSPANSSFSIAVPETVEEATAMLYNTAGQVLLTQTCHTPTATIHTTALPAGIYMLVVHTERKKYYRRVVIEK